MRPRNARAEPPPALRLVGGPTALITYGRLRILTDPTFDPPGDYPRAGTPVILHKLAGPAIPVDRLRPIDLVLISHDHHSPDDQRGSRSPRRRREGADARRAGCTSPLPRRSWRLLLRGPA